MIPRATVTPQGYVAPTREEVAAGVTAVLRAAFGPALNTDPRTPQGQLITSLTAAFTDRDDQIIELGNNFDPRYSTGVWQEGLAAIYFMERGAATSSIVDLEFTGLAGASVPAGTLVRDDAGLEWETTESAEVEIIGTVLVRARCTTPGPVSASAGTIAQLVTDLPGIDRVTNPAPAAIGSAAEGRVDFEIRRAQSVAANSKNTVSAVRGAVLGLPGVIDAYVAQNASDNTITVGATNYPMIRNSLLVSVVGGDDYDIAGQVMIKGGTGCAFVGNTDVLWRDTDAWDDQFPPEYEVKLLRPSIVPLHFDVRVADLSSITTPQERAARDSILAQMSSGENRARIGGRVVSGAFSSQLPSEMEVIAVKVSRDGLTWADYVTFGVDEFPATAADLITVSQA